MIALAELSSWKLEQHTQEPEFTAGRRAAASTFLLALQQSQISHDLLQKVQVTSGCNNAIE